jgi:hypothetical protein
MCGPPPACPRPLPGWRERRFGRVISTGSLVSAAKLFPFEEVRGAGELGGFEEIRIIYGA